MKKKTVITFSREFGSGGHTVAQKVAERLGYAFYDAEIVKQVAEKTGYDASFVDRAGEYSPGKSRFSYSFVARDTNGLSIDDKVWIAQVSAILEIADKGNCVIVGRCADFVLHDRENALHVFMHAPYPAKAKRIVTRYGDTEESAEKRLMEKDSRRAVNYKYRTGGEWGKSQNYDICLNTDTLGVDACVEIICAIAKGDLPGEPGIC